MKNSKFSILISFALIACNGAQVFNGNSGDGSKSVDSGNSLFGTWVVKQADSNRDFERYEIADGAISHILVCDHTINGQEIIAMAYSEAKITSDKIEILNDAEGEADYQKPNEAASCSQQLSIGTLSYVLSGDSLTFAVPAGTINLYRKM